jgi:hypothetical protein
VLITIATGPAFAVWRVMNALFAQVELGSALEVGGTFARHSQPIAGDMENDDDLECR